MIELISKAHEVVNVDWYNAKFIGMMWEDGWHLPTRAELEEVFRTVDHDLDEDTWYWTSDEYGPHTAIAFYNSSEYHVSLFFMNGAKQDTSPHVRLVRNLPKYALAG